MKRIKMKQNIATATDILRAGEVYEIEAATAKKLTERDVAEETTEETTAAKPLKVPAEAAPKFATPK